MEELAQQIQTHLTTLAGPARDSAGGQGGLPALVYDQLRKMAARMFARERPNHTLQPTALVHEAWMRVADQWRPGEAPGDGLRSSFLIVAANAMRQVLVDHARAHGAAKRRPPGARITLGEAADPHTFALEDLLDLQAALKKLEQTSADLAGIAELRLFAGLSVAEASRTLGVSLATAKNRWLLARTVLTRLLAEPDWLGQSGSQSAGHGQ